MRVLIIEVDLKELDWLLRGLVGGSGLTALSAETGCIVSLHSARPLGTSPATECHCPVPNYTA